MAIQLEVCHVALGLSHGRKRGESDGCRAAVSFFCFLGYASACEKTFL